jgi:hypothetical protein
MAEVDMNARPINVNSLRHDRDGRSNSHRADKSQRNSSSCKGSHLRSSFRRITLGNASSFSIDYLSINSCSSDEFAKRQCITADVAKLPEL